MKSLIMDEKIHRILVDHWLTFFKIEESYTSVKQCIPVLYLTDPDTLDAKEIKIGEKVFLIDTQDRVFQKIFSNYGNNKEIVGKQIGEYRDGKIYLDKK